MHHLDHKRDGKDSYIAIKLDMCKAYDKVEWGFIEQVMERIGFHERWISLVMHCITTVSYSILINGVACRGKVPRSNNGPWALYRVQPNPRRKCGRQKGPPAQVFWAQTYLKDDPRRDVSSDVLDMAQTCILPTIKNHSNEY